MRRFAQPRLNLYRIFRKAANSSMHTHQRGAPVDKPAGDTLSGFLHQAILIDVL
jgi:hypothetical protein